MTNSFRKVKDSKGMFLSLHDFISINRLSHQYNISLVASGLLCGRLHMNSLLQYVHTVFAQLIIDCASWYFMIASLWLKTFLLQITVSFSLTFNWDLFLNIVFYYCTYGNFYGTYFTYFVVTKWYSEKLAILQELKSRQDTCLTLGKCVLCV